MTNLYNIMIDVENLVSTAEKLHFIGCEIHELHTPILTGNEKEDTCGFYYQKANMEMMSCILTDYSLSLRENLIQIVDRLYQEVNSTKQCPDSTQEDVS